MREFEERTKELKKEIEESESRLRFLKNEHDIATTLFKEAEKVDSEQMLEILSKKNW